MVIDIIDKGKKGLNQGLVIPLSLLNNTIGGIQKGNYIIVAAPPKIGKTAFVLDQFVVGLILSNPTAKIKINFFALDTKKEELALRITSLLIYHVYDIKLSINYLNGSAMDTKGKRIVISDNHYNMVKDISNQYLDLILGVYENGKLVKPGILTFYEKPMTGDEIEYFLHEVAIKNGKEVVTGNEITYTEHDPDFFTINVLDHLRKVKRKGTMKEEMDKVSKIFSLYTRVYNQVCIAIVHQNRNINDVHRIKHMGEHMTPSGSDLKDSGNPEEDCNIMIMLFDAANPLFKLVSHLKVDLVNIDFSYLAVCVVVSRSTPKINVPCRFIETIGKFVEIEIHKPVMTTYDSNDGIPSASMNGYMPEKDECPF